MMDSFTPIKDSSVWVNGPNWSAVGKDSYIRIGVVKQAILDEDTGETSYLVEVRDRTDKVYASCRMMTRYGGVYNYEDIIGRGYESIPGISLEPAGLDTRAGDIVIVAFLSGETRYGIILGGLNHPARESDLTDENGPAYKSVFNGVETEINSDGEYTVTVKGQPINIAILDTPPTTTIVPPVYNEAVGGAYFMFNKDGGWIVSDGALALEQSIEIIKSPGTIEIISGQVSMTLDKSEMSISLSSSTLDIESTLSVDCSTTEFSVDATASIKLKAAQIAIGSDSAELLDLIGQLIQALGQVQPISPLGPCTPLMATPQWISIEQIKLQLKLITGSL